MRSTIRCILLALALVLAPAAAAEGPRFGPTIQLDSIGGTEPRVAVGVNDHRYVITNRSPDGLAAVFVSKDKGATWAQAGEPFPGQSSPTIDVDVVTMPDGRILASELDSAGLNFPSAVSDDGGKTWTAATGATNLADQDRQFFAVGPLDEATGKHRVYMAYHNLASGSALHNVFVATSTDGGVTFGAPVPVTLPGDDAFADLQCAAGYPSNIAVNPKTGQIYVFYISRSQAVGPLNGGGCGASLLSTFEINIISATRVWVATSMTGGPGTWTNSLAVDTTDTNQIVAMQFAPGALDNQGNVHVAYPESPNPYPDYSGAAIKVVRAAADLGSWTKPVTLVPAGGAGSILPLISAGDPGKVAVAYYKGAPGGETPSWYLNVAASQNLFDAQPAITDERVSDVLDYTGTASELMGACSAAGPASGVQNGLTCGRATDVNGMEIDADCRLTITWTAVSSTPAPEAAGTYVTTQNGGPALCGKAAQQGGSTAPTGPFCRDTIAPSVTRSRRGIRASRRGLAVRGTASDRGCLGSTPGRPVAGNVAYVDVAIAREVARRRCAFLSRRGRLGRPRSCDRIAFLRARGAGRWSLAVAGRLPRGRYRLVVRATDRSGNASSVRRPVRFRVR